MAERALPRRLLTVEEFAALPEASDGRYELQEGPSSARRARRRGTNAVFTTDLPFLVRLDLNRLG